MACVPPGATVRFSRGQLRVGSLIDAGRLLVTGGSLGVVDQGVVTEFQDVTIRRGAAVWFAGRIEGGTLTDAGYLIMGKPRIVVGSVAVGAALVTCIPGYTPTNVVDECMRSSSRFGRSVGGPGTTATPPTARVAPATGTMTVLPSGVAAIGQPRGTLTDAARTPLAREPAPLDAAADPMPAHGSVATAPDCSTPPPTGEPAPGRDHPALRRFWRRFASEVNAIACDPERNTARARRQLLSAMSAQACLDLDQRPPTTPAALVADCQKQLRTALEVAPLRTDIDNLEVFGNDAYGDAYGNVRFTFHDGVWRIAEL